MRRLENQQDTATACQELWEELHHEGTLGTPHTPIASLATRDGSPIIPPIMNLLLEFDPVNKIVRVSLQGEVTDDFLWLSYEALTNLCDRYSPRGFIVDFTKVTNVKLSSQGVLDLASKPPIFPDRLILNVAPQDEMNGTYGLSRMFQKVAENRPDFRVLRTMDEALDLLEVKSPKFDAILDTRN